MRVRWAGKDNKSIDGLFFVAPVQSTIELVLGNDFVCEHGRADKFCTAEEVGDVRIMVSDSLSVSRASAVRCGIYTNPDDVETGKSQDEGK